MVLFHVVEKLNVAGQIVDYMTSKFLMLIVMHSYRPINEIRLQFNISLKALLLTCSNLHVPFVK